VRAQKSICNSCVRVYNQLASHDRHNRHSRRREMAILSTFRSTNPMTTHLCNLAQKVSASQQADDEFVAAMNSARNQRVLWQELRHRSCACDRYTNLLPLHRAFMRLKSNESSPAGIRSAQLFFVRLAVRTPDALTTVHQELRFTPQQLWTLYAHLGWRVYLATMLGEMSLAYSHQCKK